MENRRRLAALGAASLLTSVGAVPAVAVGPAAGPAVFTGTVYLPDGTTVARAAAVDLSLGGVKPFNRGVTGVDGRFSVDVPETSDLVTLALASGSALTVRWTASDLHPAASVPPPDVSTQTVLGTVQTSPGFAQVAGEFTAYLVDTATETLANAVSDPKLVEFRLPATTSAEPIVTRVADLAHAAGIFNDPDMLRGLEDLDDPRLIPPLNVDLEMFSLTEADMIRDAQLGDVDVLGGTVLDGGGENAPSATGCPWARTYRWTTKKIPGIDTTVFVYIHHCTNEVDTKYDFWAVSYWGWVRSFDTDDAATLGVWRFKFRNEATHPKVEWRDADPKENDEDGGTVGWTLGLGKAGPYAEISDDFSQDDPGWMHPWPHDTGAKTYHVSFLSDDRWHGAPGGPFHNGGGTVFQVGQGTTVEQFIGAIKRDIWIMRCWVDKETEQNSDENPWVCDPSR